MSVSAVPLFADRFELGRVAGSGGMGTVYQAVDRHSGERVAVKLVGSAEVAGAVPVGGMGMGWNELERFLREAQVLSQLEHPGIVRYLTHGQTHRGQAYLVMEWLEGEDLGRRLARQPLLLAEALLLLRRTAAALAVAHRHGVVHRDLKPSNLFLRGCDPGQVAILDFGIALRRSMTMRTRTGVTIGTPEYMAPEQARGDRGLGPAADIFSLGCVFYECLMGRPPFIGDHVAAVLAKILFEAPPPLRPGLPVVLERVVARMLAKDPGARPQDADALVRLLDEAQEEISTAERMVPAQTVIEQSGHMGAAEQVLVSVVLAVPPAELGRADADSGKGAEDTPERSGLRMALRALGADVAHLPDGSIVATVIQHGNLMAREQVTQAARCALALRRRLPQSTIVLTTGRGLVNESLPMGEAVDRAASLLRAVQQQDVPTADGAEVRIDETTAGLLQGRFQVQRLGGAAYSLLAEKLVDDEQRPLLGKPTPCVGRDRELGILDLVYSTCRDDSRATVVLVTAPAGTGKTRLRVEFCRRIEARGDQAQVWLGRGDPVSTGSTYAMLAQVLRQISGIVHGEAEEVQRAKLTQRLGMRLGVEARKHRLPFLGELCGIHWPEAEYPPLRAARQDARMMSEQMAEAFIELLRVESQAAPLLVVLEDLHWCDALTIRLIDMALRELAEQPLLVIGLARPEVESLFPRLWQDRHRQDIRLEGLARKPSERLVRLMLGPSAPAEQVARIIDQAAGNALFLEEPRPGSNKRSGSADLRGR